MAGGTLQNEQVGSAGQAQAWNEPELKHYLGVFRRRIWMILTAFIVVATLGAVHAFKATPIYEAQARILIEKQGPRLMSFEDVVQMPSADRDYYKTQEELATSRAVLERAIEVPGVRELLEGKGQGGGGGGLSSLVGEIKRTISAVLATTPTSPPELWERLREIVEVEQMRDTHLLLVRVVGAEPARAAALANAVARAFEQYHVARKQESSSDAFSFLEEQKEEQEQKVFQAENALQEFREQTKVVSLDVADKSNPVLVRLNRLNGKLTEAQLRRIELGAQFLVVQDALDAGDEGLRSGDERLFSVSQVRADPATAGLRAQLFAAEKEATALADIYGPEHPRFKAAEVKRSLVAQELSQALSDVVGSLSGQLAMLTNQGEELKQQYKEQNRLALELAKESLTYNRLQNDVGRQRRLFDVLVDRLREVDLTADYAKTNVEVVEAAEVPKAPVEPRKARIILFSVFMGLFLGVGLAFFFEYLDDTVKTPEDLEGRVGISVLGFVPAMDGKSGGADTSSQRGKVSVVEPMSSVTEAYRNIRTSLFFSAPAEDTKTLVVTSCSPRDGKTTTAANLALVIAQSGKRVLLMDADFRRPMIHRVLELSSEVGLSTVLVGQAALSEAVQKPENNGSVIEGLDVLVAGPKPPNPAELLDSAGLAKLLEQAREEYDRVILDTPPVLFVADASIVGARSDGVIMVVKAAKNTRSLARRAKEQLEGVNARVLGGILNDVRISRLGYYYSDYYYYGDSRYYRDDYGSYYSREDEEE